jgi:leucine dehydrogenase
MNVFSSPDFDDHEHVAFFSDEEAGLRAIVAIHSSRPFGLAGGGCRFHAYATPDEALRDVLALSRAMTFKLALAGIPSGGAKSVVLGDPATTKNERLLRALGRCIDRLGGRYVIAQDVGTTEADMAIVAKETKFVAGQHGSSGEATAYGAFAGIRASVARALGRDLRGVRVAIQGLGQVGYTLARLLHDAGARLVVADVDPARVERVRSEFGAAVASPDAIASADADVFAPCAMSRVLTEVSIPALRCKVVAGAANVQLDDERLAASVAERGILLAPDFVLNMGGVLSVSDGELPRQEVEDKVAAVVGETFALADARGIPPYAAAVLLAKGKVAELRAAYG